MTQMFSFGLWKNVSLLSPPSFFTAYVRTSSVRCITKGGAKAFGSGRSRKKNKNQSNQMSPIKKRLRLTFLVRILKKKPSGPGGQQEQNQVFASVPEGKKPGGKLQKARVAS